jgi:hypothetical protein
MLTGADRPAGGQFLFGVKGSGPSGLPLSYWNSCDANSYR